MATERLEIVVIERGVNVVNRNLKGLADQGDRAENSMSKLRKALLGLAAVNVLARMARGLMEVVDSYTNLQSRLKLVTQDTAELSVITKELFDISNRTRTGIENTSEVYLRLSRATQAMGLSQAEALKVTESLNQAVIISGANATEAKGALIQLAQALASNRLSGDEFRSVSEQLPFVLDVIAKKILGPNGTGPALKSLAKQGKITTKVIIEAFQSMREEIAEKFARMAPTIEGSLTVLTNKFRQFVGEMDQADGISGNLARGILYLANNFQSLARGIEAVAIAAAILVAPRALGGLAALLAPLAGFLVANPLIAFGAAMVVAAAAIFAFRSEIALSENSFVTLGDVADSTWISILNGSAIVADAVKSAWFGTMDFIKSLFPDFQLSWEGVFRFLANGFDLIIGGWLAVMNAIVHAVKLLPDIFAEIWIDIANIMIRALNKGRAALNGLVNAAQEFVGADITVANLIPENVNPYKGRIAAFGSQVMTEFSQVFEKGQFANSLLDSILGRADLMAQERILKEGEAASAAAAARKRLEKGGPDRSVPSAAGKVKRQTVSFDELLNKIRRESNALTLNTRERERAAEMMKIEDTLRKQLKTRAERNAFQLTKEQRAEADAVIRNNQLFKERAAAVEALTGPQQTFLVQMNALNGLMLDGTPLANQWQQAMADVELSFLKAQAFSTDAGSRFAENFTRQLRIMQLETRNVLAEFEAGWAEVVGPGGTLVQGLGDVAGRFLVFRDNLWTLLGDLGKSILSNLVSNLVQVGLNLAINAALGESLATSAVGASVTQAKTVGLAWAPAASLASLATLGGNAAAAIGAIAATTAIASGAALTGFDKGGYTGDMSPRAVAGVVHGKEFVVNARGTRKNRAALQAMNSGKSVQPKVTIINNGNDEVTARQMSDGELMLYIDKRIPVVVEGDMKNANSKTSRAINRHQGPKGRKRF